jgi:hypothetical protein
MEKNPPHHRKYYLLSSSSVAHHRNDLDILMLLYGLGVHQGRMCVTMETGHKILGGGGNIVLMDYELTSGPPCSWGYINIRTWPSRLGESQEFGQ